MGSYRRGSPAALKSPCLSAAVGTIPEKTWDDRTR
jgi:hypothetical protein